MKTQELINQTESFASVYDKFEIKSPTDFSLASEGLRAIKAKTKELDAARKSLTQPLDESKKKIMAMFKKPLDKLKEAESVVKKEMVNWRSQQEEVARLERERLAEIQRKEAEALRLAAQKEAERIDKLKTKEEKEQAIEQAVDLAEQAEMVESVPIVIDEPQKVAGISMRTIWKFKVIDINKLPSEYLIADEKMIGKMVKATQGKVSIPGVEIFSEQIIAAR